MHTFTITKPLGLNYQGYLTRYCAGEGVLALVPTAATEGTTQTLRIECDTVDDEAAIRALADAFAQADIDALVADDTAKIAETLLASSAACDKLTDRERIERLERLAGLRQ